MTAIKPSEALDFNYQLSKLTHNHANKCNMGASYSNLDDKNTDYHVIDIYLDNEDESDASIVMKVEQYRDYEFVAKLWAIHYNDEIKAKVKAVMPDEVHGEKELRALITKLGKFNQEVIDANIATCSYRR